MEIRLIDNGDFIQLCLLAAKMYAEIDPSTNQFGAVNTLVNDATRQSDFKAIGLYDGDQLQGFVTGYGMNEKVFYFSGIYVMIKQNEWTKKLIDFSFDFIRIKGYSAWTADATNGNISSILEGYGAEPKYTRYYKEFA